MPSAPTPPTMYGHADPPPWLAVELTGESSGGAVFSWSRGTGVGSVRGARGADFASLASLLASAVGAAAERAPAAGKSMDTTRLRSPRATATRRSTTAP